MDMSTMPPLDWHRFVTTWHFAPGWTLVAALALAGYLYAVGRARARGRRVSPVHLASWLAAMVVLVVTVSSAVDAYAMSLFWMHMVEHLLLIMVVPALMVLGHPLKVLRTALDDAGRSRFDTVLHSGAVGVLTHPLVGFAIYTVVIVYTHLGSFMDDMAMHAWLMPAEQIAYVVSGYLFLVSLLGREPLRHDVPPLGRVMAMLLGMTPDTVVGIVLMQSDKPLSPMYYAMRPGWAKPALDDQYLGGSIMWAFGDGLMMVLALIATVALLRRRGETALMGSWLENVRRNTLREHVASTGGELRDDVEADDDEALAAYNRMLSKLSERE